jgi:hypothetical protein
MLYISAESLKVGQAGVMVYKQKNSKPMAVQVRLEGELIRERA